MDNACIDMRPRAVTPAGAIFGNYQGVRSRDEPTRFDALTHECYVEQSVVLSSLYGWASSRGALSSSRALRYEPDTLQQRYLSSLFVALDFLHFHVQAVVIDDRL